MEKENLQFGVPISLSGTAIQLNDFIEKNGIENFSIYMGGKDTSYGIVWVKGNTSMVMSGIHAMVQDIAKNMNKTEEEVASMILQSVPQKVDINYN